MKLVLVDSDETLRRNDGVITKNTKNEIKKFINEGNYVVLATGRPRYHTLKIMKEAYLSPIIISSNGAEIYDSMNNKIINAVYLDKEECFKLIYMAFEKDIRLTLAVDNIEYVTKDARNNSQILINKHSYKNDLNNLNIKQCFIDYNLDDEVSDLIAFLEECKHLEIINKSINFNVKKWISIGGSISSKGYALKVLRNYLNISKENTYAIGNDYNDLSMLKEANVGIAVDNAYDDIKKEADFITLSNEDDGVAYALEKIRNKNIKKYI